MGGGAKKALKNLLNTGGIKESVERAPAVHEWAPPGQRFPGSQ